MALLEAALVLKCVQHSTFTLNLLGVLHQQGGEWEAVTQAGAPVKICREHSMPGGYGCCVASGCQCVRGRGSCYLRGVSELDMAGVGVVEARRLVLLHQDEGVEPCLEEVGGEVECHLWPHRRPVVVGVSWLMVR